MSRPKPTLESLPDDVLHMVMEKLPSKALGRLSLCSRRLNAVCSSAWFIWRDLFFTEFGTSFWRGPKRGEEDPQERNSYFNRDRNDYLAKLYRPDRNISNYHQVMWFPEEEDQRPSELPYLGALMESLSTAEPSRDAQTRWRTLYYSNANKLHLWRYGKSRSGRRVRVLVFGRPGSGKTSLLRAAQFYMDHASSPLAKVKPKGSLLTPEDLSSPLFPPRDPFDACSVVSFPFEDKEIIMLEMETCFQWIPKYKGVSVDRLVFCAESHFTLSKKERIITYDHLHGTLGEANNKRVNLSVLLTKKDMHEDIGKHLGDLAAFLRVEDLGQCGWYMSCTAKAHAVSALSMASVEETLTKIVTDRRLY